MKINHKTFIENASQVGMLQGKSRVRRKKVEQKQPKKEMSQSKDPGERVDISSAALETPQEIKEDVSAEKTSQSRTERHMEKLENQYGKPEHSVRKQRDSDKRFIRKHGNTKLKTLDKTYGKIGPDNWDRENTTLKDILDATGYSSLTELVKHRREVRENPPELKKKDFQEQNRETPTLALPAPKNEVAGLLPAPENNVAGLLPAPENNVAGLLPAPENNVVGLLPAPENNVAGLLPAPENNVAGLLPAPEGKPENEGVSNQPVVEQPVAPPVVEQPVNQEIKEEVSQEPPAEPVQPQPGPGTLPQENGILQYLNDRKAWRNGYGTGFGAGTSPTGGLGMSNSPYWQVGSDRALKTANLFLSSIPLQTGGLLMELFIILSALLSM